MAAVIELENVTFRYANHKEAALQSVSLAIEPGECVVVTGPSGCGKTTLTRLVNGLIPHAYEGEVLGSVHVEGQNVSSWTSDELGVRVGSVFQNPRSQFVNLDVLSEIAFGCENLGLPREDIVSHVSESASALCISPLLNSSVDALSGGQRQSVIIASAYAMHPDIFVLDEPTASLDMESIRRLAEAVSRLKAQGKTVLISEHRLWWLLEIADRVVAMEDGAITNQWGSREFALLSDEERRGRGLRAWDQRDSLKLNVDASGRRLEPKSRCLLSARSLTVGYKRDALILENLNLELHSGRIVGITGKNGAGKTTLLRCLCGLEKEQGGTVSVEGVPVKAKLRPTCIHLVMQEPGYQLFGNSVISEALAANSSNNDEVVRQMLDRFGLLPYEDRHPLSLSGGERQRLSIAVGMLRASPVMLLDEPTSGLDYRSMKQVAGALKEAAASGCAVCVVTHDLEFLLETCDEIVEISEGNATTGCPLRSEEGVEIVKRLYFKPTESCTKSRERTMNDK